MMGLLRRRKLPEELVAVFDRFLAVLRVVERAKEEVLAAVPGPRTPGVPLGEALFSFSASLAEASEAMAGWRSGVVEEEWLKCAAGVEESSAEADRLRSEAPDLGFEELLGTIGDLIAPLEAFEGALERFTELKR